jgi:beta-galactosidase/beta-glucuronidase
MKNETDYMRVGGAFRRGNMTGDVTQYATSSLTFSNVTVSMSRATSYDVTQVLVVLRILARLKGLVLRNLV